MMFKNKLGIAIFLLVTNLPVYAAGLWVTGTISRTLSDGRNYGGCMIALSQNVGNGCPDSGWVSLDCNGGYNQAAGERMYATALLAFSLNKPVSVFIENTYKYNGYCVATRLDMNN